MVSTWQSTTLEVNPGSYSELSVLQGKANIFFVTNPGNSDIYVSMSNIPRIDAYEKLIYRNSTDVFGRPTNVSRVYFLNLDIEPVTLRIWYTYTDDFDYTLLKPMNVSLEGNLGDAIKYDGIITGIRSGVSFPVVLDNTNAQRLASIVTNTAKLGDLASVMNNTAAAASTLASMYQLMQQEASTNTTILEGINALIQEHL